VWLNSFDPMTDDPTKSIESLNAFFELGKAVGLDPFNDKALNQGGGAVTNVRSFWLHRRCPTCSHTFRVGDEVHIAPGGNVQHSSPLLPCAQGEKTQPELSNNESADFFAELYEAWPPPKDLPIIRLDVESPLLAPPYARFKRHACAVCGHTLRVNDHVTICPCSLGEPLCQAAIHCDRINGLSCLESWNPGINQPSKQRYCPITSRRIDDSSTENEPTL
jgi:hypothetical protein